MIEVGKTYRLRWLSKTATAGVGEPQEEVVHVERISNNANMLDGMCQPSGASIRALPLSWIIYEEEL